MVLSLNRIYQQLDLKARASITSQASTLSKGTDTPGICKTLIRGGSASRSKPFPFHTPFLTERVLFLGAT